MSTPTPGRRAAARRRPRPPKPGRGALPGIVLVLLAGVLLAAAGMVQADPEPAAAPETVPVEESVAGCLGSPANANSQAVTVAAPLPESTASEVGEAGGGTVTAGPAGEEGKEVGGSTRGRLAPLTAAERGSALAVSATEGSAVGRGTFQVDEGDAGLAVQECLAPRSRWWFTGGGAALDHQSALVMANLDPGPAVVDVVVAGPDGVAEDLGTRGITLAPGEVRAIELVEVAPQSDELAVHVEATRGRVVAGLSDSFATRAAAEPGLEWVPTQPDAARSLRLSPLPRSADGRTLVVDNPSDRDALVEIEVSGESGAFAPTGVEQLQVPAGSVATADLGKAIGKDASAVHLRSDIPVTATVRSSSGSDVSYAAAAPVLDGPAAAMLPEGATGEVQLTAGQGGGAAQVTAYSDRGRKVDATELQVAPTGTLAWSPKGKAAYVVVDPVKGDVAGGVSIDGAAGVAQVVLRPLPVVLTRPVVVPVVR